MNDPDVWEPDAYDFVILEWNPDGAYLLECGTLHPEETMSQDDHGDVLAFVVPEDWVEECIAIADPPKGVV